MWNYGLNWWIGDILKLHHVKRQLIKWVKTHFRFCVAHKMQSNLCNASKNKTDVIYLSFKIKRPLRENRCQVYKNAINHRGNGKDTVVNNFDHFYPRNMNSWTHVFGNEIYFETPNRKSGVYDACLYWSGLSNNVITLLWLGNISSVEERLIKIF